MPLGAEAACSAVEEILPGQRSDLAGVFQDLRPSVVRMNIFLHGTYQIITASLSPLKTYNDQNLSGSLHEFIVRSFFRRRQRSTYENSLIYDEGFYRIDHTAAGAETLLEGQAVLPIVAAFSELSSFVDSELTPDKKIQLLCYIFGWNGLLGQSARREASVALFNAISWEKHQLAEFFAKKGQAPKIEICLFCHSHGGNVALNLAWINEYFEPTDLARYYSVFYLEDLHTNLSSSFAQLLKSLPKTSDEANTKARYPMDKWLYEPTAFESTQESFIDKLYMFGTPIQSETWPLLFSNSFAKTVNCFSEGDSIQNGDFLSTVDRRSERTVSSFMMERAKALLPTADGNSRLTQLKIVLPKIEGSDRKILEELSCEDCTEIKSEETLRRLFLNRSLYTNSKGPSHLEYAFVYWSGFSNRLFIRPAPIMVFAPLLYKLDNAKPAIDVCFQLSENQDLLLNELDTDRKVVGTIGFLPAEKFVDIKKEFFKRRYSLENKKVAEKSYFEKAMDMGAKALMFFETS